MKVVLFYFDFATLDQHDPLGQHDPDNFTRVSHNAADLERAAKGYRALTLLKYEH